MTINKQVFELVGVTIEEYLEWCVENNFPSYKEKTKKEFFARINDGRIVRDTKTRYLVNKRIGGKNNDEN